MTTHTDPDEWWPHDVIDKTLYEMDVYDQAVERELIREANERHELDKWVSLGLIVLMTLLLVTPKALRWIYFLWR